MKDKLWWLSFADGDLPKGQQFLGVVLLRARHFMLAQQESHWLGINPGGSMMAWEWPEEGPAIGDELLGRLLSRSELEQAGLMPVSIEEAKEQGVLPEEWDA